MEKIHLDIAGLSWPSRRPLSRGLTGVTVRTLAEPTTLLSARSTTY